MDERAFEDAAPSVPVVVIVLMIVMVVVVSAPFGAIVMMLVDELGVVLAGGALVVAVAMVLLAQLVDAQLLLVATGQAQHGVDDEAHHHADDDLGAEDLRDGVGGHLLGDEDGQHLIRRRQEHGEQRAQRDHTAGVERRRGCRETALGNHSQHRADDRARRAGMLDGLLRLARGAVLEPLHRHVGDEQKRDEVQRVGNRVLQDMLDYVRDFFHSALL